MSVSDDLIQQAVDHIFTEIDKNHDSYLDLK